MFRLTAKRAFSLGAQESKNMLAMGLTATSRIKNQLSNRPTVKIQRRFKSDTLYLSSEKLKPGYEIMRNRLHDVMNHAAIAAVASPVVSGAWLAFTEQSLGESPVAIAALGVGACVIADRMMQAYRVKKYAKLSLQVDSIGPANSEIENKSFQEILAGNNPSVKFGISGISVSGTIGDISNHSPAKDNALSRIHSMNRVVIPSCVLTNHADNLISHTQDRWLARINFPLAIINIMGILGKKDEDRRADDYVVLAASIASIADFFSGDSVKEARDKLSRALTECRTPEAVLKVLIDNKILDEGGMSFLKEWVKNQDAIALRVGRTGTPIIYKNRTFSFGGPYPIRLFPEKAPVVSSDKEEVVDSVKRISR